ncbi:hypothetical protein C8F01DRAFT_1251290 [Mycena amicta]|nr:hypothetical protein C8F01DRAFT_1251290 [Mycena amicta]
MRMRKWACWTTGSSSWRGKTRSEDDDRWTTSTGPSSSFSAIPSPAPPSAGPSRRVYRPSLAISQYGPIFSVSAASSYTFAVNSSCWSFEEHGWRRKDTPASGYTSSSASRWHRLHCILLAVHRVRLRFAIGRRSRATDTLRRRYEGVFDAYLVRAHGVDGDTAALRKYQALGPEASPSQSVANSPLAKCSLPSSSALPYICLVTPHSTTTSLRDAANSPTAGLPRIHLRLFTIFRTTSSRAASPSAYGSAAYHVCGGDDADLGGYRPLGERMSRGRGFEAGRDRRPLSSVFHYPSSQVL